MNKNLFCDIQTKNILYKDVIEEVGYQLEKDNIIKSHNDYFQEVLNREKCGDIEIFPEVILPHIQSENILKTKIYLIKNEHGLIQWHKQSVKLIILLNLKPNEDKENLLEIQSFMRNLADEDYIESLIK
ncbi:PTS sugar transporter subunit IIA [Mammaliicoccus sp. P-M57]|uniref:PTS sugar transporter subunit IIA n=1 Tax=Mammaliicoccus sp. P-M57 TaxID=2898716 RepID=UPI001EFAC44D|nr:PTS sugar transporter subunit IIA [Mammaliicoccus sp. P-M57]